MGSIPNIPMSPPMQQTMQQQAQTAMFYLQQRGQIMGIQLAGQQALPNSVTLFQFQVQFMGGPMVWRLWLDQAGTLVGLHFV